MILVAKCDICKKDSDYNSKDIDQTFCWFLKTPFKNDRREMIQLKIVFLNHTVLWFLFSIISFYKVPRIEMYFYPAKHLPNQSICLSLILK